MPQIEVVSVLQIRLAFQGRYIYVTLKLQRVPCGDAAPIVCYQCDCGETTPGFLASEKLIPDEIEEEIVQHVWEEHITHAPITPMYHNSYSYFDSVASVDDTMFKQLMESVRIAEEQARFRKEQEAIKKAALLADPYRFRSQDAAGTVPRAPRIEPQSKMGRGKQWLQESNYNSSKRFGDSDD